MELFKIFGTFAINGVEKAKGELQDVSGTAKASSGGISSALKKVGGAVATYFAVDKIKDFGLACINAAADANAANAQFSSVFGELEAQAKASLTGIANETGVAETRMKGSYTKIAAFAKTTGMDTAGALDLSNRAMMAVADSAAFYDRSLEDTTESLQSFLKGNFENDAALGLSCTETTRNAAANELYGKSFKDLSESQKQLTLLKMVEDANKTSGALGQAARESDTWSNQLGNLKQSWTDFMAVVGQPILDIAVGVVKTAATAVSNLTQKFTEGTNPVQFLIDKFTTFKTWLESIASYASSTFQPAFENLKNAFTTAKDMVQPLIDKFVEFVTNGDLAKIATDGVKGAIDLCGSAFETATGLINGVVEGFKSVIEWGQQHPGIITAIAGAFGTLAIAIGAYNTAQAIKNAGGIVELAQLGILQIQLWALSAAETAHAIASGIAATATTAFGAAMAFLTSPVTLTVAAIAAVIAIVVLLVKNWDTIKAKASEVWGIVVKKITEFKEKAGQKLNEFIEKVKKWASDMAAKAKEAGTKFVNNIVTFFTQLPGKIWTFLSNVISKVTTWASNMASKAKAAATQFITNAVNTIQALPGRIWTFLSNVISKVAEWGSQMLSKGKEAASKLVEAVTSKIKEMPGKVADVGRNLVEGIWEGITGSLSWIKGKLKTWVGDVTSFVKNLFGIHSPATEWRDEIGIWLARGLAEGITEGTSDVEKASAALGEAAANSAFVSDAFREAAEKGTEEYINAVNNAHQEFRNNGGHNKLWSGFLTKPLDELYKEFGVTNNSDLLLLLQPNDYLRALLDTNYQASMLRGEYDYGKPGGADRITAEDDYIKEIGKVRRTIRFFKGGDQLGHHTFILGDNPYVNELDEIAKAAKETTSVVKTEAGNQGQTIKDAAEKRLNDYIVYNKMTLSEEVAYWNEVRKMAAEGTDERIELDRKYFEVKQNLDDQMLAAEEELQSTLSDIYGKVADRKKSILDSYGLFGDGDTTTDDFYFRLYGQVKGLEQYQKDIDALEARIGGTGLYEAIKDMGLDAHEELVKINGMTDDALQNYVELYDKRSELAGKLAKDELKDTVAAETEAAYKQFATTVAELGGEVQSGSNSIFESMRQKAVEAGEAIGACEQHLRSMFDMYADDMAAMFGEDSAFATFSDPSIMTTMAVANNHSNDETAKELPKEQKEFNSGIMARIKSMDERLRTGFAQLAEAFDVDIVLDSGVLVGALAADMNVELGKISMRKDRGR